MFHLRASNTGLTLLYITNPPMSKLFVALLHTGRFAQAHYDLNSQAVITTSYPLLREESINMPVPSTRNSRNTAARFFSRKQQWRRACRAGGATIRHEKENTTNGQPTLTEDVEERCKFRGQELIQNAIDYSPACNIISVTTSTPSVSPENKPAAQVTSQRTNTSATPPPPPPTTPPCSTNSEISSSCGVNIKAKRRVCFDSKIRVVLVPTRHELKSKSLLSHNMATSEGVKQEDYSSHDNGIWWTMRDCFEFRRAYRRQIIASGLKCKSLLCPTEVVFLIGAEDEEEKSNENRVSSSSTRASSPYQVSYPALCF